MDSVTHYGHLLLHSKQLFSHDEHVLQVRLFWMAPDQVCPGHIAFSRPRLVMPINYKCVKRSKISEMIFQVFFYNFLAVLVHFFLPRPIAEKISIPIFQIKKTGAIKRDKKLLSLLRVYNNPEKNITK